MDTPCVWIARAERPLPDTGLEKVNVVILVCEDGSEEEALHLSTALQRFNKPDKTVLVGRLTIHTLRHLGWCVGHVIALPATAESQLGGTLWRDWHTFKVENPRMARLWESLRLDLTYMPVERKWYDAELGALRDLRLATEILPK